MASVSRAERQARARTSWRVFGDRLWDGEGRLWVGVAGEWLTPEETDVALASADVPVVHGPRVGRRAGAATGGQQPGRVLDGRAMRASSVR